MLPRVEWHFSKSLLIDVTKSRVTFHQELCLIDVTKSIEWHFNKSCLIEITKSRVAFHQELSDWCYQE